MDVAQKLQLKPGQRIAVLRAPADGCIDLGGAGAVVDEPAAADAVVMFATTLQELDDHAAPVVDAARRDAVTWIAYPKARQMGTDLNRDVVARHFVDQGVRPVRQISIDEVWSALRFRPA